MTTLDDNLPSDGGPPYTLDELEPPTTLDDFWPPPETPANPAAPPPRRHRHVWTRYWFPERREWSVLCDQHVPPVFRDEARSKRGKAANKRGGALQLWAARTLGLVNLPGSSGRETDARSEAVLAANEVFVAQIKSGLVYPGWMERILDGLPRTDGRIPLLAIVKTPGPGNRRRALVVLDIDDWCDLHTGGEE